MTFVDYAYQRLNLSNITKQDLEDSGCDTIDKLVKVLDRYLDDVGATYTFLHGGQRALQFIYGQTMKSVAKKVFKDVGMSFED